ncbi:hypothetical protein EYF80_042978 [Liparis tanakae]|uniref:Uncharacterized protein n=1 Tax=Liparis tanakae TaxID=230148 RepID=A0A4Z2FZR6_9TELE|nr:hypothetical protein EYF80_042978 [Liparis tanakae]
MSASLTAPSSSTMSLRWLSEIWIRTSPTTRSRENNLFFGANQSDATTPEGKLFNLPEAREKQQDNVTRVRLSSSVRHKASLTE